MLRNLTFLFILLVMMACAYGYEAVSDVAYIKTYRYQAHQKPVDIYYDNDRPVKEYVQFAVIEIKGAKYDNMNHLLNLMRQRAQAIGADGVMNVRKDYAVRERGLVTDAFFDEKPEKFTAPVFTGIAIKYVNESEEGRNP